MYFGDEKLFSKEMLDSIEISKNFPHSYIQFGNIIKEYFNSDENRNHSNDSLEYGNWEEIKLLDLEDKNKDFFEVHRHRHSSRIFQNIMDLQDLSNLLQGAYYFINDHKRNFPAAGGVYSIDVYFINLNISDLEKGIYVFDPEKKVLLKKPLLKKYYQNDFYKCINKSFPISSDKHIDFDNASGIIVFGSMFNKLALKYRNRGFRMGMIEAGALMQNFYLSASYYNIGCCAYYAYFDDNLAEFLSLNPPYEMVSLVLIIGK